MGVGVEALDFPYSIVYLLWNETLCLSHVKMKSRTTGSCLEFLLADILRKENKSQDLEINIGLKTESI